MKLPQRWLLQQTSTNSSFRHGETINENCAHTKLSVFTSKFYGSEKLRANKSDYMENHGKPSKRNLEFIYRVSFEVSLGSQSPGLLNLVVR